MALPTPTHKARAKPKGMGLGILHSAWCATVDAGWTFTHHFLLLELRLDLVLGVAVDRFVQLRKQTTDLNRHRYQPMNSCRRYTEFGGPV